MHFSGGFGILSMRWPHARQRFSYSAVTAEGKALMLLPKSSMHSSPEKQRGPVDKQKCYSCYAKRSRCILFMAGLLNEGRIGIGAQVENSRLAWRMMLEAFAKSRPEVNANGF